MHKSAPKPLYCSVIDGKIQNSQRVTILGG